jgi:perosamine synthetase
MPTKLEEIIRKAIVKISNKKTKIFLHKPYLDKTDQKSLVRSIKSSNVSTYGITTSNFEKRIKEYTKAKYVVALNSGTSALQLAIIACGIKKNQEVLIPSLNFIASSNAVIYNASIPHYIDSDYDLGIHIEKLEKYLNKITQIKNNQCVNLKTGRVIKAIIPTHIFGRIININKLKSLCKKFKLIMIEDSSEAFGAFYKKKHAGTFGLCGAISFNGNKIITTGGGGAILTNSKKIFTKIKFLATVAKKGERYDEVGYNYRMPSLNAALGISQLNKINYIKKKKYLNHLRYKEFFKKSNSFSFMEDKDFISSNYWLNYIIFKSDDILNKKFFEFFNNKNIEVRKIWALNSEGNSYKKYPKMDLKISKYLSKRIVCIPSGVFN